MPGTVKTASELEQAVILRSGGYSLAAIAGKTGISPATLARHFKRRGVTKGALSDESVEAARQQLLSDAGYIDGLKHEIASAVADDIAHVRQIREAAALLLEELMNDKSLPPHYKTRGLAALATSLTLTQKAARVALQADNQPIEQESLPELTITELSNEDIERMRREQQASAVYPDDDVIEADVIEESVTDD
jgi:AcrR family transcriptional regulator